MCNVPGLRAGSSLFCLHSLSWLLHLYPGQDPSQELLACISSLLDVYLHLHVAVEPLTQPTESLLLLLHSCHSILPGAQRMLAHVVTTTPCQLCLAIPLGFHHSITLVSASMFSRTAAAPPPCPPCLCPQPAVSSLSQPPCL